MTWRIWALVSLLLLAACAPSLEGANERGGIIRHTQAGLNMGAAFTMANDHCQKYGRVAQITGTDGWTDTVSFNCVEK